MRQVLDLVERIFGSDEIRRHELEIPKSCGCGLSNVKIWGTRINGRLVVTVRCMRCGKPLSKVERLE